VRYQLKTPYRDGTTHVVLEPLDFIARLAALIPKPRVNLTGYHGVFAPNSSQRGKVTPGQRGRRIDVQSTEEARTDAEHRAAMSWVQRLKRIFKVDIETCEVPLKITPSTLCSISRCISAVSSPVEKSETPTKTA
jgi:hypothetical protein